MSRMAAYRLTHVDQDISSNDAVGFACETHVILLSGSPSLCCILGHAYDDALLLKGERTAPKRQLAVTVSG